MAKSKVTSRKAAPKASKTLRGRSTGAKSKKAGGSARSQTKTPQKTTSRSAAAAASKVAHDKRPSKSSKSAPASALSRTQSKGARRTTGSPGRETIRCSEVMTKDPVCCVPNDTVQRAAQLMKSADVGPIPVVSDQQARRLIGIITDRDLAVKVVAEARDATSTTVEEVMTTGVKACRAGDDLQKALNVMGEHQVRRIPVVDENDHIVGIIAQADVATQVEEPKKTAEVVEEISKMRAAGR